jgi:hypothetical protein
MTETMKIVIAIGCVFASGFILVGLSKQESPAKAEAASMIRNYAAIQTMANEKCPIAVKKATGEQVYFPSETQSDKEDYITLKWKGENSDKGGFKAASCTLLSSLGGISELIIDNKVIIKK